MDRQYGILWPEKLRRGVLNWALNWMEVVCWRGVEGTFFGSSGDNSERVLQNIY